MEPLASEVPFEKRFALDERCLLAAVSAVLIWSGIAPYDRLTWLLETSPVWIGLPILIATHKRFRFTPLVYWLIAAHCVLLCVGGHYTYARVPPFDWLRDYAGLSRNHFDRLGHFAQGFVPAMIAREIFIRLHVIRVRGWLSVLIVTLCLSVSVLYELIEYGAAVGLGSNAEDFLATQGDEWDTQADMLLALVGAISALLTLPYWHDNQLRNRMLI